MYRYFLPSLYGSALFPKAEMGPREMEPREMEPLQMQHSSAIFHKQKPVIDVLIVVSFNGYLFDFYLFTF